MNAERRKRIERLSARLCSLQSTAESLRCEIEEIRDEGQEAFDNMPESLQDGDRGQASQSALDAIEMALDNLASVDGYAQDALSYLGDAIS